MSRKMKESPSTDRIGNGRNVSLEEWRMEPLSQRCFPSREFCRIIEKPSYRFITFSLQLSLLLFIIISSLFSFSFCSTSSQILQ
jgi:hypothetical protein